jgi:hypothetical protein
LAARLFISLVEVTIKEGEMFVKESLVQERMYTESVDRFARRARGLKDVESAKVADVCCSFADGVDWRFCPESRTRSMDGDGVTSMRLTENEPALHVGSFIGLTVMPVKDTLELKGGCFNMYYQPATVYEECLPLTGLSAERLERTLTDMHHRLEKYYRSYVRA